MLLNKGCLVILITLDIKVKEVIDMKKKIVFFMFDLKGGGAERTVVNILNNLNRDYFEITLILGLSNNHDYIKLISHDVNIRVLDCKKLRYCLFKLRKVIREENPDLLFSTLINNNIMILLARILSFKKIPTIVRVASNRSQTKVSFLNKALTRIFYNLVANKVIALSKGVKTDLIKNFSIKKQKIEVIYNPVEVDKIRILSQKSVNDIKHETNTYSLLTVGRLAEEKDHSTLIKAFSLVLNSVNAKLYIVGRGPKEEELKKSARDLGIKNKVEFLGFKKNPYKYMKNSDVFILSSLWEGFSHVIVEAMAVGTPVISTDCNSGPAEIIKENEYGILVPVRNHKVMAEKILEILRNEQLQKNYKKKGEIRSNEFKADKIVKEYDRIFLETIR